MSASPSNSWSGRLWLAGIGLFLALAGAVFTWVLWTAWQRAEETRRWTPTPCTIVSSQIASERPSPHSNIEHRVAVRYSYTFAGQPLIGTKIKRVNGPTAHEEIARKKQEQHPVGLQTTCYVNPAHPDQAVLVHDTRAALYSIWFPVLFIVGGLGISFNALKRARTLPASVSSGV